jgi:hypothetical protein
MKMELLTNATIVDDAIRFVSPNTKGNMESTDVSNEYQREASRKHDYDIDED